jgi:hypothetical protein
MTVSATNISPKYNNPINESTNVASAATDKNKFVPVKLIFTPAELGIRGNPPQVKISEAALEKKLFQRFDLDPTSAANREILKLRLNTRQNPGDALNWEIGNKKITSFDGVRNAQGNYETEVLVDVETFNKLAGKEVIAPKTPAGNGGAGSIDPKELINQRLGLDAKQKENIAKAQNLTPSTDGLSEEEKSLMLDLTQVGLSIAGIFDPTGIADGADALISLGRGDYWGAGISALGMIPYLGDLAKIGKLPKLVETVGKVIDLAKKSPKFAKAVGGLLEGLKATLDKIPTSKLPASLRNAVESMKKKIDEIFSNPQTKKSVLERGDGAFVRQTTFPYDSPHPNFPQIHDGSCVAASAKNILGTSDIPEAYIRSAAKVDAIDGGKISDLPKALEDLGEAYNIPGMKGFKFADKLGFDALETAVKKNPVVVSIKTEATGGAHALVVDAIKDGKVFLRDSLPVGVGASYAVSIEDFMKSWTGKAVYK